MTSLRYETDYKCVLMKSLCYIIFIELRVHFTDDNYINESITAYDNDTITVGDAQVKMFVVK